MDIAIVNGKLGPEIVRGDEIAAALVRQGDRYLMASEQDRDPAIGMTHASYARLIYEGLGAKGLLLPRRLKLAGDEQDRWGRMIRLKFGAKLAPSGL